ncbi:sensor histidine kinase [Psychroserpens luteolus]|uniref:sensor histidine kinase n=1 Tax=Psychroserpens luteolus TaxID=2855840 RepID=UPI001E3D8EF1|nr:histidine kinase [Psychroserpens luteolus]MCD2259197.1 histidine kinase [Psychroserpens luteolus]
MKSLNIWFHIGFWIAYTLIYTLIQASYKGDYEGAFIYELMNLPLRLAVVYFNYFYLLPKFLLKGKVANYFVYTIITLCIAGFFQRIINYELLNILNPEMRDYGLWLPYKFLQSTVIIASPLIFVIGISVVWKVSQLQKRTNELENEKLQSELKYLKSQINPHFLFNTLNNIYGLSLENSRKTPELILKLSDFLSFSLYESNQKMIPLDKEIALMTDFITLEKSRFEDRVAIGFNKPKSTENISIPPLILVPFVENAFKHSLKDETKIADISIDLKIDKDMLLFEVKNSKSNDITESNTKKGLGLENIKKRLDILYGNDHELTINDSKHLFTILLKIKHL